MKIFQIMLQIGVGVSLGLLLGSCSIWPFGHKSTQPLAVNPIVIPAGVPPIKMQTYYQTAPVVSAQTKPVSIFPPGSALSRNEHNGN